jgi:hypothetical protein
VWIEVRLRLIDEMGRRSGPAGRGAGCRPAARGIVVRHDRHRGLREPYRMAVALVALMMESSSDATIPRM